MYLKSHAPKNQNYPMTFSSRLMRNLTLKQFYSQIFGIALPNKLRWFKFTKKVNSVILLLVVSPTKADDTRPSDNNPNYYMIGVVFIKKT